MTGDGQHSVGGHVGLHLVSFFRFVPFRFALVTDYAGI